MGSFTPPPTTSLAPGDCLDRYQLLCVLAQGGMGTVWLARMTGKNGFERLLALKTILPSYSNDRQFCDMFLDEARIAAQIDHENVARILDIGEDRGVLYYAMELIDGHSVRKLYRDVREAHASFPLGVALRIVADACAGLHATHELRGPDGALLEVVHRDVSPQNLLVTVRGTTKLIDFGVAKARARTSEETAAGTLKGKIDYMAPEQARGESIDRRADVYSVGALLYELLAGIPLRDTREGKQLLALHELMTGVPHAPLPPSIPAVVRDVVERAIARDVNERFPSADALRIALEQAMVAIGQVATTTDVARVLTHFSSDRLAKRRDAMERAIHAAPAAQALTTGPATVVEPRGAVQPPPTGTWYGAPGLSLPDGPVTTPSVHTVGGSSVTSGTMMQRSPLGRATMGLAALVLAAVLGGLAGFIYVSRTSPKPTVAVPAPSADEALEPETPNAQPPVAATPTEAYDPTAPPSGPATPVVLSPMPQDRAATPAGVKDAGTFSNVGRGKPSRPSTPNNPKATPSTPTVSPGYNPIDGF